MQIPWGSNAHNGTAVVWDSACVINPHIGIFGDTGMGKTHLIRHVVTSILATTSHRVRFHVFDSHDDIDIDGASTVRFSESADFGFNPLELNSHPDFGGIRKRIQSLITAINRTAVRLGPRQERALSRLLTGLYRDRGFFAHDSSTWSLDAERPAYPTLVDAIECARELRRAMYIGADQQAAQALEEVNRMARVVRAKEADLIRTAGPDHELERLRRELDGVKKRAIDAYTMSVTAITTGDELDELLESNGQEEILQSVIDRLENLYNIGIYRSTPPPLDPRCPVWRYVIAALGHDEKKLFTMTRLETIFTRAVQRGRQQEILDVVVLDEAHQYQDKAEDYIVNRMVREVRKFGVAMIFASQGMNDYTEASLAGLGTKIILGMDKSYRRTAESKFGINSATMDFIIPFQRILVQAKNRGELTSATQKVMLNP